MHWCQCEDVHHSKLKAFDSNKGDTLRPRHWWTKSTEIKAKKHTKTYKQRKLQKYCTSKNADSCLNFEYLSYFLYCTFLDTIFFKLSSKCSLIHKKIASKLVQWIVPVKSNKNSVRLENRVKKRHNKPETLIVGQTLMNYCECISQWIWVILVAKHSLMSYLLGITNK